MTDLEVLITMRDEGQLRNRSNWSRFKELVGDSNAYSKQAAYRALRAVAPCRELSVFQYNLDRVTPEVWRAKFDEAIRLLEMEML